MSPIQNDEPPECRYCGLTCQPDGRCFKCGAPAAEPRRETVKGHEDSKNHRIEWELHENQRVVSFKVYGIEWDDKGEASRVNNGGTEAYGDVKWDGCSNLMIGEEGVMWHGCHLSDIEEIGTVLTRCWRIAKEVMTEHSGKWGGYGE